MTTNNNYILARWRDAITDPPDKTWAGKIESPNTRFASFCMCRDEPHWTDLEADEQFFPVHGDQWLDVTDTPAIPREAVQAAVDRMEKQRKIMASTPSATDYNEAYADGLIDYHMEIKRHTGVTPTEVTP